MLVAENRPRNLHWFHAGPLLYGDWGTSRLYVLGLAFFYAGHASVMFLAVMSAIMAAVAWAYTVICRCFPEGGGVYTAARQLSVPLSLVGATLLLCGYVMTAAISTVEAFHYFGASREVVFILSAVAIVAIGGINWLGSRSAGQFALGIAVAAVAVSVATAVLCAPFLGPGLRTLSMGHPTVADPWSRWTTLVAIVLALSGVESVANMTGLMRPPVERTAKRTIWPVLIEVVVLNMLFGLAIAGLPQIVTIDKPDHVAMMVEQGVPEADLPEGVRAYKDTAMKVLAMEAGRQALGTTAGTIFGKIAAFVFGLLLLSATNTALMATVSVLYSMARDRELPRALARLNYSGVPWVGLVVAVVLPIAVLAVEQDVAALARLYAIGVCGAIAINVLCCAVNRGLTVTRVERAGLWLVGLLMLACEITVAAETPATALFAGGLMAVVFAARQVIRLTSPTALEALPEPATGWMAELPAGPLKLEPGRPRIMLAARGRDQAEFAVGLAKQRRAVLFAIYVRTLRVMDVRPGQVPRVEDDKQATEALGTAAVVAREAGIPFVPIYVTSTDIASEILDYTVTFGCDTLIMGKSRRTLFARKVAGDVLAEVAGQLPDDVALITRSAAPAPAAAPGEPGHG